MADKFVDPRAYSTCEFVGSISGTTLTISSVVSGQTGRFMVIDAPGVDPDTMVTGTPTGGTGSFAVNISQTVSSRTMIGRLGLPVAVPLWGQCQDGDGLASGAATSATCSIVFSGVPSSGTISVAGTSISTTGVIGAASADAAANALAANINATTSNAAAIFNPFQLRSCVYARGPSLGAPAGTCQIMTRAGSALFNGTAGIAHTLNNVSGSSSLNWSGGVSGAWGVLTNMDHASVFAGGFSNYSYGTNSNNFNLLVGAIEAGDNVYYRPGVRRVQNGSFNFRFRGSSSGVVRHFIDDGAVWPDAFEQVLASRNRNLSVSSGLHIEAGAAVQARRYSDSLYGLHAWRRQCNDNNDGFGLNLETSSTQSSSIDGALLELEIYVGGGGRGAIQTFSQSSGMARKSTVRRCRTKRPGNVNYGIAVGEGGFASRVLDLEDSDFELVGATVPTEGALFGGGPSGSMVVNYRGCRFHGFVVGSGAMSSAEITGGNTRIITLTGCSMGGITDLSRKFLSVSSVSLDPVQSGRGVYMSSHDASRAFSADRAEGFVGWLPELLYPTLNARLLDGVTPWSIRMIPTTIASYYGEWGFLESPTFNKVNTLGAGVRTVTVELLVAQGYSLTKADIELVMTYVDGDGLIRTVSSRDPLGSALEVSTAAWSSTQYIDGGAIEHDKRKLTVTTPTAVAADTEMQMTVRLRKPTSNVTLGVFLDPEVVVS